LAWEFGDSTLLHCCVFMRAKRQRNGATLMRVAPSATGQRLGSEQILEERFQRCAALTTNGRNLEHWCREIGRLSWMFRIVHHGIAGGTIGGMTVGQEQLWVIEWRGLVLPARIRQSVAQEVDQMVF